MKKKRIFIGIPCYREVAPEVLEDYMRFAYNLGRRIPEFDFYLGIKTKSEQFRARNDIVLGAQQTQCDYLLMLDDDMIINHFVTAGNLETGDESYYFIRKLIEHDKDICGVLYRQRGGEYLPVLMKKMGDSGGCRFLTDGEIENRLQRVDVIGGGCMLFKMRVFDKIQPPYFEPELKYGTDLQICRKAWAYGFEIWADTSIELGHVKTERVTVTRRNVDRLRQESGISGEIARSLINSDIYNRLTEDMCEWTGMTNEQMVAQGLGNFLSQRKAYDISDADWYRLFPKERAIRQLAYNRDYPDKRRLTEFVLSQLAQVRGKKVLDFGCGIGLTAFTAAEMGHDVTALDIRGTGTFEFLKWRAAKYKLPIKFIESEGGPCMFSGIGFDCIIAMDSIEHISDWRITVNDLASNLKSGGVFFTNNGILEDDQHEEHYPDAMGKPFIAECIQNDLIPVNQLTFIKGGSHAQKSHQTQDAAVLQAPVV